MNLDRGTIIRGVIFVLAWVNNILAAKGLKTIPVLDEPTISTIITIIVTAYTFYKDNFKGKQGKVLKNAIVKESEAVIEKVVESKVVAKVEPVVVPVAPSNQPIQSAPVAQPEPVQPTAPTQENK